MKDLHKIGGVAALVAAAMDIVGVVLHLTLLPPSDSGGLEPLREAALLVSNQGLENIWYLNVYVLFGLLLVVLVLGLQERLKASSPRLVQTMTAFGLIWAGLMIAGGMAANVGAGIVVGLYGQDPAQAATAWLARHIVVEGLIRGNEVVGGLWVVLASWAALRASERPKVLHYLGIAIGAAGLLTLIPALRPPGWAVYGLGLIVWLAWRGIVMLQSSAGPSRSS